MDSDNVFLSKSYSLALEVSQIVEPIFQSLNANYFSYTYLDRNTGNMSILVSNAQWLEHYISEKYPIFGSYISTGVYSWDKLMPKAALENASNHFNIKQGITISQKTNNIVQWYSIGFAKSKMNIFDFYQSHADKIRQAILYFNTKAEVLIKEVTKNPFQVPKSMLLTCINEDCLSVNALTLPKYNVRGKLGLVSLTQTELQFYLLLIDYPHLSVAELANLSNRSVRTLDTHYRVIRAKLGCTTKKELIEVAKENYLLI